MEYIQKEYDAWRKADRALRTKIISYLDSLHMQIDMELMLDGTEEILLFVEIRDGILITDHDEIYSYSDFSTGELLEVLEKLYKQGGI